MYRVLKDVKSVLHVYSVNSTVISMAEKDSILKLCGYELLKGFRNIKSHDAYVEIPIFEKSQNLEELSKEVQKYL